MILILDNLRSAHNVGALFRSADGAGVVHVYLVGITPTPPKSDQLYLSPAEKALKKTALGAETALSWTNVKSLARLVTRLSHEGYEIVALEEGKNLKSIDYRAYLPKSAKVALVVGNEVGGLTARLLSLVDAVIHLPMRGVKNSLNVSVAGSIALYHLSATMEKLKIQKKN